MANRIFEMRLYNLFLAEEELSNAIYDKAQGNKFQSICESSRADVTAINLSIKTMIIKDGFTADYLLYFS